MARVRTVVIGVCAALGLLTGVLPAPASPAVVSFADTPDIEEFDPLPPNDVWRRAVGLDRLPASADGRGVTVAVIDTGVTQVKDLGNRVFARMDLTPEGDGYDRYGHGTHMIGLVAGNGARSRGKWAGVAPGAGIVSVKVAGWNGTTDVSSVIAGLEWVAANREKYGIGVVNLSFGVDSSQKDEISPLNHAVQRLWTEGVTVVAASGNRGKGSSKIDKPGDDPFVITVGAADTRGTVDTSDDRVAPFSSHGPTAHGVAKPDLVAPGITIVSNRAPDSTIDGNRPAALLDRYYTKGTGSSQATAIVSGVVALMVQANPALTPDEIKAALVRSTSRDLAGVDGAGAGLVHAGRAVAAAEAGGVSPSRSGRPARPSSGTGPIDSSRGNFKVYTDWERKGEPKQVSGEIDALGNRWDAKAWAARPWTAGTWTESPWAPLTNVSPGWSTVPWPPDRWSGMSWDKESWTAKSWRDAGWTPENWTAKSWRSGNWN